MFGWFFRLFNAAFRRGSHAYATGVGRVFRVAAVAVVVYVGLIGLTLRRLRSASRRLRADAGQDVPGGVRAVARRLDAGSHRSGDPEDVRDRLEHPAVKHSIAFPGLSINGFVNVPNAGITSSSSSRSKSGKGSRDGCQQRGRRPEPAVLGDPGSVRRHLPAPAGAGARHRRRLQALCRRSRRQRVRGAVCAAAERTQAVGSDPSSPACSRVSRSACRKSTRPSIASGSRPMACRSPTSTKRCRSTSGRSM